MRQTRHAQHGFSLIEVMITLSIAAILLAVALPSLRGVVEGSRISGVTNDLVYALQLARSEAIKRAAPARLCPSSAPLAAAPVCDGTGYADGWIVIADDDPFDGVLDASDRVVLQHEPVGAALTFTVDAALAGGVRFDASGNSVAAGGGPNPGSVTIALPDGESRTITVRASGRIASSGGAS